MVPIRSDGGRQRSRPVVLDVRPAPAILVAALLCLLPHGVAPARGRSLSSFSPITLELPPLLEGVKLHPRPRHACAAATAPAISDVMARFNDAYIDELVARCMLYSVVSRPRMTATALLTKAALLTVPGDIVETGVFQGGSLSLMLRVVVDHDPCDRRVWAFDSFRGLPTPVEQDRSSGMGIMGNVGDMASPRDVFDANVKKAMQNASRAYDPSRLVVTPGFFNETLAQAPIRRIAFLRLDGDLYESTIQALEALYQRVVPGGLIYVDDYLSYRGCKRAVDQFRAERRIFEPMHMIIEDDRSVEAVWWRKAPVPIS